MAGSEQACDSDGRSDSHSISTDKLNNKSLLSFNFVINELSEGKMDINFCNSSLTNILQEQLAGNSNTAIICNIRKDVVAETISTLK